MNEYTSPQAFSGLDAKGLHVWLPEAHLAVVDHVNANRSSAHHDAASKLLIDNLEANCAKHGIAYYGIGDARQMTSRKRRSTGTPTADCLNSRMKAGSATTAQFSTQASPFRAVILNRW